MEDKKDKNKRSWKFVPTMLAVVFILICGAQFNYIKELSGINNNRTTTVESLKKENKELKRKEKETLYLRAENERLTKQVKSYKFIEGENKNLIDFIIKLQPKLDIEVASIIAHKIVKHANKFGFPPSLIVSLMYRESAFNPIAISSAKCVGLMQINPKAHDDKIKKMQLKYHDLFSMDENIKLGCMILHEYYKSEKNIRKALTRYVGGSHESYVNDILSMYSDYQISMTNEEE